jgi:hypothetical protein
VRLPKRFRANPKSFAENFGIAALWFFVNEAIERGRHDIAVVQCHHSEVGISDRTQFDFPRARPIMKKSLPEFGWRQPTVREWQNGVSSVLS